MINDKYNALGFVPGLGPTKLPTEQQQADTASFERELGNRPAQAGEAPRQAPLVAGAPVGGQPLVGATTTVGAPSPNGFSAWFDRPENQRLVDSEFRGSFS